MYNYKQNKFAKNVFVIGFLSTVLGLAGCQQQEEGTAEKAGKEIDRAAESVEKKFEQTTEKAEEKIEAAKESVANKTEIAEQYIDDSVITMKVKSAILNDALLNASKIEVTTVNGVVKLSGSVDSEQNISRAKDLAKSQANVKSVTTELIVNSNEG